MKSFVNSLLFAAFVIFGGCSTWRKLDDTERGGVIGAGTGAVIGNAIAPGLGGTVLGGAAGAAGGALIGRESDRRRRRR